MAVTDLETSVLARLRLCPQCKGKGTVRTFDGGIIFETDDADEVERHYRDCPCPTCAPFGGKGFVLQSANAGKPQPDETAEKSANIKTTPSPSELNLSDSQRTALSELFSIAKLIVRQAPHDVTAEQVLNILMDRIRNLIGGLRGCDPWSLSDESLLSLIEEFSAWLKNPGSS